MKPLILSLTFFLPLLAAAQGTYSPMVTLPGVTTGDFDSYINSIYALSISIAALLAVIKIIIAGVKWMTTDVVTTKGEAKKDIQGALLGLIIVLSAVLIITVINPDITDVDFSLSTVSAPPPPPPAAAVPTCPYSANNASTYTYIAYDAPVCERNQFKADCVSPDVINRNTQTNELRCTTIDSATESDLNSYLSGLPTDQKDTAIYLYQNYINNWKIDSASDLTTIQTENGAAQVYYAVDLVDYPVANRSQMEGVCSSIARANGDDTGENIGVVYNNDTNYAACMRLN